MKTSASSPSFDCLTSSGPPSMATAAAPPRLSLDTAPGPHAVAIVTDGNQESPARSMPMRSRSHPRLDELAKEREAMLEQMDAKIAAARAAADAAFAAEEEAAEQAIRAVSFAGHSPAMYDAETSEVDGFLIDLDGTMYQPGSLLPGAQEFYGWLRETGKPFVFLSNTGAKGSQGVQSKLASAPYKLEGPPVRLTNAYTAAEAQMEYMSNTVPSGAKVFVISGASFWMNNLRMKDPLLYDSWDLRTNLSTAESKEWAHCAKTQSGSVFVVFFIDGTISETADPSSGEAGVKDWSYETIQKAAYMCHAGAQFVYTADDAFNPAVDPDYPGMTFPQPGPGMFAAMMKTIMFPQQSANWCCCGKGGNVGKTYMMEHAIKMLQLQGHSGDRSKMMMIGDRFDTDIKAGCSVGIKTCLVESGCHTIGMQRHFLADAKADYYAPNVGTLVGGGGSAAKVSPGRPKRVLSAASLAAAAAVPSVVDEEPDIEEAEAAAEEAQQRRVCLETQEQQEREASIEQAATAAIEAGTNALPREREMSDVFEVPLFESPPSSLKTEISWSAPSGDSPALSISRSFSDEAVEFDISLATGEAWAEPPPGCDFSQEPASGDGESIAPRPSGATRCTAAAAGKKSSSLDATTAKEELFGWEEDTAAAAALGRSLSSSSGSSRYESTSGSLKTLAGRPDFGTLRPVAQVRPVGLPA